MSLIEQYAQKEKELLQELHNKDTESYKTKKQIVQRYVEIVRKLFDEGFIPGLKKQDISSYVNGRLVEYEISYPRNQNYWSLFEDDERRNYEKGTNFKYIKGINHQHNFHEGTCECGCILLNGVIYEQEQVEEVPTVSLDNEEGSNPSNGTTTLTKSKATAKPKQVITPLSELLKRIYSNALELSVQARDIENKYQTNPDIAEELDKVLKNIPKLIEEQKSCQALLIHMSKNADFRQKIGEFEKVKAIMLERSIYNTSKVAKLLSVTPKHMTNNIITSEPEYMRNLKWFKSIHIQMPKDIKKGEEFVFNIADWYNMNLERMTINLFQTQLKLL